MRLAAFMSLQRFRLITSQHREQTPNYTQIDSVSIKVCVGKSLLAFVAGQKYGGHQPSTIKP
jgi:hypothetical protein